MATMSRQPPNEPPQGDGTEQSWQENYVTQSATPYPPSNPPTGYTIPLNYTQVAPQGTILTHAQTPASSSYAGARQGVNQWEAAAASARDAVEPEYRDSEPTQAARAVERMFTTFRHRQRVRRTPYDRPGPSR